MSSLPQTPVRPELHFHAEGALNPEVSTVRSGQSCWRIGYLCPRSGRPKGSASGAEGAHQLAGLAEFKRELVLARASAGRFLDEPCRISLRNSTSRRMTAGDRGWKFEGGRHANHS